MTTLDVIVLLLMSGAGLFGLMRGFVAEAVSLAAWVSAVGAVRIFHQPVTNLLGKMISTQAGASLLAAVLIFGVVMIAGRLMAGHVGRSARNSALSSFDRVLGLGFGVAKGLLLATVGFLFISLAYDMFYGAKASRPSWMAQSQTYPLLSASSRAFIGFVRSRSFGAVATTPNV
ncbi:MAG: CvpA family protein [Chakrabartia sp.]